MIFKQTNFPELPFLEKFSHGFNFANKSLKNISAV